MTDNRTTELVSCREAATLLEEFLYEYQHILLLHNMRERGGIDANASEVVCKKNELIDEYAERIVQAIAATLGNSRADYHGYEQAAIEAWESIKAWNSRAERPCSMTRADRLLEELNNDRRINKQLKMANALLRKSEAAKIERIEELEELARDLHADLMEYGCTPNAHRANYKPRFEALGIEVGDDV